MKPKITKRAWIIFWCYTLILDMVFSVVITIWLAVNTVQPPFTKEGFHTVVVSYFATVLTLFIAGIGITCIGIILSAGVNRLRQEKPTRFYLVETKK